MTFNLSINNENNSGEKRESPELHIETPLANHHLLLVLLYIVSFVQWRDPVARSSGEILPKGDRRVD